MAGSLPQSGVSLIAQNAGAFISQMSAADKALGGFGKGAGAMSNIVTGAFRQVGAIITNVLAGAVRAVGSWVKDSIGVAGDFEETLNVLGATSGATAEQLDQVASKAKELGADMDLPTTSANDAAEVMLELSKAGFSVQESMDAAKGALLLAAAADTDAATATGILTGAINAFGLEATDATRIADLLAAGANASSASMTDLGAGLQQAGAIAHTAGLPVEDLITSLAALTNVGYTGSDAGTALKNALVRLIDPTDKAAKLMAELGFNAYDANGKMKPLPVLIRDLNKSLAGMTDEQRNAALSNIFLSDGMKAMIPLLALGEDGFLKLKDQVTEEGAAVAVASARMKGWNGAVATTKSQLETLQLTIGTLLKDALTPLLFKVAEFIPKVTTFAERAAALAKEVAMSEEPFRKLLFALTVLIPPLGSTMRLLLLVYNALKPIVTALAESSANGTGLAGVLTTLLGPLGATQGAIDTAVGAVQRIQAAFSRVAQIIMGEFGGSLSGAQGALATVVNFILEKGLPAIADLSEGFATKLPGAIATGKAAFADIGLFVQTVMPTIESIISTGLEIIRVLWEKHGAGVLTTVSGLWESIKGAFQIALGVIQGAAAIALAAITGDWKGQMGTIQASNATIWEGIRKFLGGILNAIAGTFGTTLDEIIATWRHNFDMLMEIAGKIMNMITGAIGRKLQEIKGTVDTVIGSVVGLWSRLFGELAGTVSSVMNRAASIVSDKVASIKSSFGGITSAVDSVISAVKRLIDWLGRISVPDIVLPGSPTPLERGFRGIERSVLGANAALRQFTPAASHIPAALPPTPITVQAPQTNSTTYQMPIYTNQSPAVLSQGLALLQAVSQ